MVSRTVETEERIYIFGDDYVYPEQPYPELDTVSKVGRLPFENALLRQGRVKAKDIKPYMYMNVGGQFLRVYNVLPFEKTIHSVGLTYTMVCIHLIRDDTFGGTATEICVEISVHAEMEFNVVGIRA